MDCIDVDSQNLYEWRQISTTRLTMMIIILLSGIAIAQQNVCMYRLQMRNNFILIDGPLKSPDNLLKIYKNAPLSNANKMICEIQNNEHLIH